VFAVLCGKRVPQSTTGESCGKKNIKGGEFLSERKAGKKGGNSGSGGRRLSLWGMGPVGTFMGKAPSWPEERGNFVGERRTLSAGLTCPYLVS